jgi:site-specific DNA-methyltransferase (adenine-specific)
MAEMPDNSVDSIVCDPPYELGFMGKAWDASGIAYDGEVWRQALRVLKPGGHLLAFSGSRTYHRMACAIEDAGFEIRDQIMWVYGSGFPKSLDVSKAIDKAAGAEREVIGAGGRSGTTRNAMAGDFAGSWDATTPATEAARQWSGWGTALKPAHEPICMARKPLQGTVAANVLRHGTGAINVDGCRVAATDGYEKAWDRPVSTNIGAKGGSFISEGIQHTIDISANKPEGGRWPANFIHDGSDEATAGLGEAARFFYCAKASRSDREEGCDDLPLRTGAEAVEREEGSAGMDSPRAGAGRTASTVKNHHPCVKPTDLMRYLVRMVTPPGGTVLDPFMGSGSTGKAATLEGFNFIGIEMDEDYLAIAQARINAAIPPIMRGTP